MTDSAKFPPYISSNNIQDGFANSAKFANLNSLHQDDKNKMYGFHDLENSFGKSNKGISYQDYSALPNLLNSIEPNEQLSSKRLQRSFTANNS